MKHSFHLSKNNYEYHFSIHRCNRLGENDQWYSFVFDSEDMEKFRKTVCDIGLFQQSNYESDEKFNMMTGYFSVGHIFDHSCPVCGSHDLEPISTVNRIEKYKCQKCDTWFGVKRVIAGILPKDHPLRRGYQ